MFADPITIMFGKLVLAALLGVVIGTERSVVARQPAGMRTFALVSLGSCIFILAVHSVDPTSTAIAGSIVSGVGFIGAGLIFMRGESVHGITTAAGLWIAAGLGILVAFGNYPLAIFAAALTLMIFFGLWYIERMIKHWHDAGLP